MRALAALPPADALAKVRAIRALPDDQARRVCLGVARSEALDPSLREAVFRLVAVSLPATGIAPELAPDVAALADTALGAAAFDLLFAHAAAEVRAHAIPVLAQLSDAQAARLRVRAAHRWIADLVPLLRAAERSALDGFVGRLVHALATECMPMMGAGDEARSEVIVARVEAAIARRLAEPVLDRDALAALADGLILAAPAGPETRRRIESLAARARERDRSDLLARVLVAWARLGVALADEDAARVVASPAAHWLAYRWLSALGAPVPAPLRDLDRRIEACAADWLALEEGTTPTRITCVERRTYRLAGAPLEVGLCRAELDGRVILVAGEAGPDTHGITGQLEDGDDETTRTDAWARLVAHHGLEA